MKRQCPECKQIIDKTARVCFCGWKQPQPVVKADHGCKYSLMERRCPLPGTVSPYPYGNGPWYCSGHLHTLDDHKKAEAVLIDAEKNYHKILEDRRDWRR